MKITTITVSSRTRRGIIGDAIRSVPWADEHLVVEMAGGDDDTLEVAREAAGGKFRIVIAPAGMPFDEIRNFGLEQARGDWGCILDTDWRMRSGDVDVRAVLESTPIDQHAISVMAHDFSYGRPIFFRLPAAGRFSGTTHERYSLKVPWVMRGVRFYEIPKTAEQLAGAFGGDLAGLTRQSAEEPQEPRWLFYLGYRAQHLKNYPSAINYYKRAIDLQEDPEERAWALYCLATCLFLNGNITAALERCSEGNRLGGDFPEHPWLAGLCCLHLGDPAAAMEWEGEAIRHSWARPGADTYNQARLKHLTCFFEAPYSVLVQVHRAMDQEHLALMAEMGYHRMLQAKQELIK